MINIGVLGAGHLGKIHIKLLKEIADFNLVGFYDPDPQNAAFVSSEFGIKAFTSIESLLEEVDAVDIVTPTVYHFECAKIAIAKNKHFFIEKPLTNTVKEAEELVSLVKGTNLTAMVGHVERFNPAYLAAKEFDLNPLFVEAHRLAEFKPRGTDVTVVLDLMIHDIDILLNMVKSKIENVSASGVAVISENIDIANARIEFENGCVANLTASRVSLKTERKMRIFQKNAYITLDFHKKEVNVFKVRELAPNEKPETFLVIDAGEGKPRKEILYSAPKIADINSIKYELELFAKSILNNTVPAVTLEEGYQSLLLAHQILEKIDKLIKKQALHS